MNRKSFLFALAFIALLNTALALDSSELTLVSDNNVQYNCLGCNTIPEGQEGPTVWYSCNQPNCELGIARASQDVAVLKFAKSRIYFGNKKLMSINAFESSPDNAPFDLNGIEVPFVGAGDVINFARANTLPDNPAELGQINAEYFQRFVYEVGRSRIDAANRPVSLCGQEFYDTVSQIVRVQGGRQINRNSWFNVKKTGQGCAVSSYRISTDTDLVYLVNQNNRYARTYLCGSNHVQFRASHLPGTLEPATVLTNFECRAERDIAKLQCPQEGESNNDERLLCEQQTKNVILRAGSTLYFVNGGSMTVLPQSTSENVETGTTVQIKNTNSIKVFSQSNLLDVTPDAQTGDAELRFAGRLDVNSPVESILLMKKGLVFFEQVAASTGYVLNRPEDTQPSFRYALQFEDNSLKSIADSSRLESSSQNVVNGITIIGLRVVENLLSRSGLQQASGNTFNLYPLREGRSSLQHLSNYRVFNVPRDGMHLRDIAREELGANDSNVVDSAELIRETSGLHYSDSGVAEERRGPRDWATPNQFGSNNIFRINNVVLLPMDGATYQGADGNRLRVTTNPTDSDRLLEERSQRRGRRLGTDERCTSAGGECMENAALGDACTYGNGQQGAYVKNKCLSNPSSSYLCCTSRSEPAAPGRVLGQTGVQCHAIGGVCASIVSERLRDDYHNDRNAFCNFDRSDIGGGSYRGTLGCNEGLSQEREGLLFCCGPRRELPVQVETPSQPRTSGAIPIIARLRGEPTIKYPGEFDSRRLSAIPDIFDDEAGRMYSYDGVQVVAENRARLLLDIDTGALTCTVEIAQGRGESTRRTLVSVQNKERIRATYFYDGLENVDQTNGFHRRFKRGLVDTCNSVVNAINARYESARILGHDYEPEEGQEFSGRFVRHPMVVNFVSRP